MKTRNLSKAKLRAYSVFKSTTKRTEVKPKTDNAILPQPTFKPRLAKFYSKIEIHRSEKAAIREKPRQIGSEWFTGKKTISMEEHKRRSEAAKKAWEKRKEAKKEKPTKGAIIEDAWMYRNTLGTGLSDHQKDISFTLYTFTWFELDYADLYKVERKLMDLITKWMQRQYPKQRYTFEGNFDEWSHGREIVRKEAPNTVYPYDSAFINTWVFEVHKQHVLDDREQGEIDAHDFRL